MGVDTEKQAMFGKIRHNYSFLTVANFTFVSEILSSFKVYIYHIFI
jgi:hypothetical protein